jgi:neutral trehalase
MNLEVRSPSIQKVKKFIFAHQDETVRTAQKDDGLLIGLPNPYTVSICKDALRELYNRDAYFTPVGLLADGRKDLAIGNTLNGMNHVERFGFMPNGNRTFYSIARNHPILHPGAQEISLS